MTSGKIDVIIYITNKELEENNMSHYSVAVVTKEGRPWEVEELLNPYDENLEVEPWLYMTKAEVIEDAKKINELTIKNQGEVLAREDLTDEQKETANRYYKQALRKKKLFTDEDFYDDYIESNDYETDENGDVYVEWNDNSKWDWWVEGGRWSNMLKIKEGSASKYEGEECVDSARISDIDFEYVEKEAKERAERFWEIIVEGDELKEGEKEPFNLYNVDYLKDRYINKEGYVKSVTEFRTYAILLPDGTWCEPGQMGWFGVSSASNDDSREFEKNYFKILDREKYKDHYLTIVDCHI